MINLRNLFPSTFLYYSFDDLFQQQYLNTRGVHIAG